jgi:hypothetical protein
MKEHFRRMHSGERKTKVESAKKEKAAAQQVVDVKILFFSSPGNKFEFVHDQIF